MRLSKVSGTLLVALTATALQARPVPPASATQIALAELLAEERAHPMPSADQCAALQGRIESRRFGVQRSGRILLRADAAAIGTAVESGHSVFTAELTGYCGWTVLIARDSRAAMDQTLQALTKPAPLFSRSSTAKSTPAAVPAPNDGPFPPALEGETSLMATIWLLLGAGALLGLAMVLGRRGEALDLPVLEVPEPRSDASAELLRAQAERDTLSREVRAHIDALQDQINRLQARRQKAV